MSEPSISASHLKTQLAHFASIPHHERFIWQTKNAEVARREREVLRPVADAIRARGGGGAVRVLESGSGAGENLVHLTSLLGSGSSVAMEGIDPSSSSVAHAVQNGLAVREGNGLSLLFPDQSFHVVYCRDVLHHLADDRERQQFVSEMLRVAKPGGDVFAIEPNPANPWVFGLSWMVRAEHGLHRISEKQLRQLVCPTKVMRIAPSALWRALCHYRSPLYRVRLLQLVTWKILAIWEWLAARGPSMFWAYRVYVWNKLVTRNS